jgi:UDP-N-acetylmuramate--alanine ligase
MEYFGTEQTVIDSFDAFLQNVRPGGLAIVSADCANARKLGTRADVHRVNYGTSDSAQWKVTNYAADARRSRFVLETAGRAMSQVTLSVHGVHNACNATAALAAAEWAGVPLEDAIRFIAAYAGIRRRMEIVSENEGITIVDDYAHHPTEVRVTLRAARERWGGRLIAIFQPHRYSRTRDLHASFSDAFDDADHIIVTEIYGAYEMPIEGVSGRLVADSIRFAGGRGPVEFLPDKCQVFAHLREHLCSGDVLLFLGAGDITHWAHEFSNHPQIGT